MQQYVASAGDTVDLIAARVYGRTDGGVVEAVLEANPGLADTEELAAGTRVRLPELDPTPTRAAVRLWD